MPLSLLVIGCVLLLALALSATEFHQRQLDHRALRRLRGSQAARQLDSAEYDALEPFRLTGQLGPSNSVYRIEGEHSLREVDAHTKIERLGSVPVLLPYGMRRHLSARNRADVVLGRSFALVVWLNGHTITGERERETQAQTDRCVWLERGTRQPTPGPCTVDTAQGSPRTRREETEAERSLRQPRWLGISSAVCIVLASTLFWVGGQMRWGSCWGLLAVGAAMAGLAVALGRQGTRPLPPPAQVVRIEGVLSGPVLQGNGQIDGDVPRVFVDTVEVHVPRHWCEPGVLPFGRTVTADVREEDRALLAVSPGPSRVKEALRHPRLPWARHLLWLTVAVIVTLWSLGNGEGVIEDLRASADALRPSRVRTDAVPSDLLSDPPRRGDKVQLTGLATCGVRRSWAGDREAPAILDCGQRVWTTSPVAPPPAALPPAIAALGDESLLKVRVSLHAPDALFLSARQDARHAVLGSRQLVDGLELACQAGLPDCGYFRERVMELLATPVARRSAALPDEAVPPGDGWRGFAASMQRIDASGDAALHLTTPDMAALHALQRAVSRSIARQQLAELTHAYRDAPPGVILREHRPRPTLAGAAASDPWQALGLTSDRLVHPQPFDMAGWVVNASQQGHALHVDIDTASGSSPLASALVRSTWRLLAVLLLLVQLRILMRCGLRAEQQRRALASHMRDD